MITQTGTSFLLMHRAVSEVVNRLKTYSENDLLLAVFMKNIDMIILGHELVW